METFTDEPAAGLPVPSSISGEPSRCFRRSNERRSCSLTTPGGRTARSRRRSTRPSRPSACMSIGHGSVCRTCWRTEMTRCEGALLARRRDRRARSVERGEAAGRDTGWVLARRRLASRHRTEGSRSVWSRSRCSRRRWCSRGTSHIRTRPSVRTRPRRWSTSPPSSRRMRAAGPTRGSQRRRDRLDRLPAARLGRVRVPRRRRGSQRRRIRVQRRHAPMGTLPPSRSGSFGRGVRLDGGLLIGAVGTEVPHPPYFGDSAAFDPVVGTWRMLPPAPIGARTAFSVWTGRELVVWGSRERTARRIDGAAYDPITNAWRPIPDGPTSITDGSAVWTGDDDRSALRSTATTTRIHPPPSQRPTTQKLTPGASCPLPGSRRRR